jgi:hypothetical protein
MRFPFVFAPSGRGFLSQDLITASKAGGEGVQLNFHDPGDLLEQTIQDIYAIPIDRFFNDEAYKGLREQWVAAFFGVGYGKYVRPCRVAMNESWYRKDADFFLQVGGKEFPFQTTERQREGRKRGDDYKKFARVEEKITREPELVEELRSELLTPYQPALGGVEGPSWIEQAIAKKVGKHYAESGDLNLLVYVNFDAWNLQADVIRERTRKYRDVFASIWIITDRVICSLYSNDKIGHTPQGKWGIL